MSTRIIDGTKISNEWRLELKARVRKLKQRGITPGLAIILVGDNPASRSFVRLKEKACSDVGIHSELHHFESADQDQLVGLIDQLNTAGHIHGILVQLPLPGHIDPASVVAASRRRISMAFIPFPSAGWQPLRKPSTLAPPSPSPKCFSMRKSPSQAVTW